jgi:hypothetical protein
VIASWVRRPVAAGRRVGRRAIAGVVITWLVVAVGGGLAGATAASTDSTSAASSSVTLVSQSAWVGPTGTFEVRVRATVPADAQLVARIYVPISTQHQLDDTEQGGDGLGELVESVRVPASLATHLPDGSLRLDYPLVPGGQVPTYGLHLANPGVYPFELQVEAADGSVLGSVVTQLIRLPAADDETAPLSIALVTPFGTGPSRTPGHVPHLSAATLADLQAETVELLRHPQLPIAVVPVPETIDTLSDLDKANGTNATPALARAIGSRTLIPSSYVPVDSGGWLAHGLGAGYDDQLVTGHATLGADLGIPPDDTLAVTDGTTTPAVLSAEFAHGTREVVVSTNHLVDESSQTDQATGSTPLTQWFDVASSSGQRLQAVPADPGLDAQLSGTSDPVLAAHRVLASLALIAFDRHDAQACVRPVGRSCRRGLAIELPAKASTAAPELEVLMAALADPAAATGASPAPTIPAVPAAALTLPVSVSAFLHTVDPAAESGVTSSTDAHLLRHLSTDPPGNLDSYPAHYDAATHATDAFASMVEGTGNRGGRQLLDTWQKLVLTSGSTQLPPAQQLDYLDQVVAEIDAQTAQISAPTQQTVTLTSTSGRIPFSISNPLPYPVKVKLTFQSPKLDFQNGNQQVVLLPASQPRHLQIAVTARASGAFPMQITITSPDGTKTITHTQFDVRSTAVSGIGLVLTIAAGLFLLLWWGRHWRDARRKRRLVESTHPVLRSGAVS